PEGFAWRDYAAAETILENRWFALQHLLAAGVPEVGFPAEGPEAAAFATALGMACRGRDDRSASSSFEHARWRGDRSYLVTHQLADTRFRRGEWPKAVRLFEEAARSTSAAEVWTYVNGARAAVKLGAFRAAFSLLEAGKPHVSGHREWRAAVHEAVEAWFAARSRRARRLYSRPEARARADRLITGLLDRAGGLWDGLDPVGASVGPSADGKVVILASFDLPACAHYRVEQKAELLHRLGRPCEVYGLEDWAAFIAALPGAAAAIVFRVPAWPTVIRAIHAARRMGVPVFYEVDDLIFDAAEFPAPFETYGGLLSEADYEAILFGTPLFRKALSLCDYGLATTTSLARAMEPLVRTGRVFVVPNGLDSRNEAYLALPPRRQGGDEVRVIYASGTKAHNADWDELAGPAMLGLMEARPEVTLTVVGHLALAPEFDRLGERVVRIPHVEMTRLWTLLGEADVNLAVLKPSWATDAKSEIKWLEAAVLAVPSVVSATATYREVLTDGEDALLVETTEDWRAALERLVGDPELRARIGGRARDKALARYSPSALAPRLETALRGASRGTEPRARRPLILLANVWFPPQSVGGAARVVRDNLDAWLEAGTEFDFAVLTTDDGAAPPYRLRVDDHRGVPVHRVSVPGSENMDWRSEDPEVRRMTADILQRIRPDLVHLHAVQRLTASAAEAARDAGIPYLVTPHDAWWISDWHFLTDERGRPREPGPALVDPPPGVSPSQSRERIRRLKAVLDDAEAVLGVSPAFAALHRRCGLEKVLELPNGAPPLGVLPRTPSPSGRVRLAHVGNAVPHKGFDLVQAVLKQSRLANLELTVIDHARETGSEERLTWGATPVCLTGRRPQDAMPELYAQTDVLLAPSIWPESFGLVAREALQAGCWVVASDRDAIGEDVSEGVNGFVVDVSNPAGLLAALEAVNGDPARFLAAPALRPKLRTAAQQASELLNLYRRVLSGRPLGAERDGLRGRLAAVIGGRRGPPRW
ncbi:MAG: glycosyltransferase, partial [Pseudomonadota bacterium]|nr:glycosyltransferase [Pseudomonadota bacterium]